LFFRFFSSLVFVLFFPYDIKMSSNNLIDRKYYSLYIGNLSGDIRRKELCQFLERFGQVDQCQLFEANHRRWTCFAFVLMATPDSINKIMSSRPHFLDNRRFVIFFFLVFEELFLFN
jgi:RNA recognition motif-containing protein